VKAEPVNGRVPSRLLPRPPPRSAVNSCRHRHEFPVDDHRRSAGSLSAIPRSAAPPALPMAYGTVFERSLSTTKRSAGLGAPIRELLLVEALGHARVPFARFRPDHRVGIELPAIDPHRAAEAAADLEGRLDDGVACEVRRERFEIGDFPGRGGRAQCRLSACQAHDRYAPRGRRCITAIMKNHRLRQSSCAKQLTAARFSRGRECKRNFRFLYRQLIPT
jgi:hypothetical protein